MNTKYIGFCKEVLEENKISDAKKNNQSKLWVSERE